MRMFKATIIPTSWHNPFYVLESRQPNCNDPTLNDQKYTDKLCLQTLKDLMVRTFCEFENNFLTLGIATTATFHSNDQARLAVRI